MLSFPGLIIAAALGLHGAEAPVADSAAGAAHAATAEAVRESSPCPGKRLAEGECRPAAPEDGAAPLRIDARCVFERLIRRYAGLPEYRDTAKVTRVVRREGVPDEHTETRIDCSVREGVIEVVTPGRTARGVLSGLVGGGRLRVGEVVTEAKLRRDLALAPHMGLSLAREGEGAMPAATAEGLTPARAGSVMIGDRAWVYLELTSGDPESLHAVQMVDLWIDAESMLVERVYGRQRLADGAEVETTLEIEHGSECAAPPPADAALEPPVS